MSEMSASDFRSAYTSALDAHLAAVDSFKAKSEMLDGKWSGFVWPASGQADHQPDTGLPIDQLAEVAKASVTLPETFVSSRVMILPS